MVDDCEQESKGRKSLTYQRQNKLPATIFSNNWKDLLPIDELMTSTCTKDLDKTISINSCSKYIRIDLDFKILFDSYSLMAYIF